MTLALVLALSLTVPAMAASAPEFEYVKFSEEPLGVYANSLGSVYLVVPDDTQITATSGLSMTGAVFERTSDPEPDMFWNAFGGFEATTSLTVDPNEGWSIDVISVGTGGSGYELPKEERYVISESTVEAMRLAGFAVTALPSDMTVSSGYFAINQWALEPIDAAYANGLLDIYGLGSDLRSKMTRAYFAEVTIKLYEAMSGETVPPYDADNPFEDVEKWNVSYYAQAIFQAYSLGFVNGTGGATFSPTISLTREQAAAMLSRVYTKLGGVIPTTDTTSFSDDSAIAAWAKSAVAWMADKGICWRCGR